MPLNPEQIEKARELLLEKRALLSRKVQKLAQDDLRPLQAAENSREPMDSPDDATDTYEQEFAFISVQKEEDILQKVNFALQRLHENSYGECDECGEGIAPERLEALPWATLCVKCQGLEERGLRRARQELGFERDQR